jgi:hypothetical protein
VAAAREPAPRVPSAHRVQHPTDGLNEGLPRAGLLPSKLNALSLAHASLIDLRSEE